MLEVSSALGSLQKRDFLGFLLSSIVQSMRTVEGFSPSWFPIGVVLLVFCQYLLSLGKGFERGGQAYDDVRKTPRARRPTPRFRKSVVKIKLGVHISFGNDEVG